MAPWAPGGDIQWPWLGAPGTERPGGNRARGLLYPLLAKALGKEQLSPARGPGLRAQGSTGPEVCPSLQRLNQAVLSHPGPVCVAGKGDMGAPTLATCQAPASVSLAAGSSESRVVPGSPGRWLQPSPARTRRSGRVREAPQATR